jgi:hypothetical protein
MSNQKSSYNGEAEAWNMRLVGHTDLNGHGDAMQIMVKDNIMYVGHIFGNVATSIVDISDLSHPKVVKQLPSPAHTRSHKVQTFGDTMIINYEAYPPRAPVVPEKAGIQLFDISDRTNPKELGFFDTGGRGVHRPWYIGGQYVNISTHMEGYTHRIWVLVDVSDPMNPREVSRWWHPGMWTAGGEEPTWPPELRPGAHHAIIWEDRAYLSFWDAGFYIMCIANPEKPKVISHMSWIPEDGRHTHTILPLPKRNLLVTTDEETVEDCKGVRHHVRVIDISDERNPRILSKFPVPEGDFCQRGDRFGPHNLHENRPESFQSDELMFVTYFNAGLRVVNIQDPENPREVAYYIPQCPEGQKTPQTNSVFVAENGLIYISDRRNGGVDILEMTL